MPPLAVDTLLHDSGWQTQLDAWLAAFTEQNPDVPDTVRTALQRLREADAAQRRTWASALLGGRFSQVPEALVPFLGAALQLAWRHWLKAIDIEEIREREDQTECPCCGSLPVAGGVVHQRRPPLTVCVTLSVLCAPPSGTMFV